MDYPTLVLAPFCRPKVEFIRNSHIGDYAAELFVHLKDFHLLLPHLTKPKPSQPSQKCRKQKLVPMILILTLTLPSSMLSRMAKGHQFLESSSKTFMLSLKNMTTPLEVPTIPTIVGFLQNSHPPPWHATPSAISLDIDNDGIHKPHIICNYHS